MDKTRSTEPGPMKLDFRPRARMTRWYEPLAMVRLLLRIWATRRMADQREQSASQPVTVFDYHSNPHPNEDSDSDGMDFWFDYTADLGDAFDPTMCIAWHLGRPELRREDIDPRLAVDPEFALPGFLPEPPADDIPDVLPRGELLILGGDQVYPNGSPERYRNQVVGPYGLAASRTEDDRAADARRGLLALPANHDWYGGIGPFRDVFCRGRSIGDWRTAQRCSWWSARLPNDWWVWGVDTALDGTINEAQYQYFRAVKDAMPDGARLIVCLPVPAWRLRERYVDRLDNLSRFFFGLGVEPEVFLSGDYHIAALHRRDLAGGRVEWHLTSGGGGAFQHPVHNLDRLIPNQHGGLPTPEIADNEPFQLVASWPSSTESREGTGGWWHLLFDRAAPSLIATLAALQLLVMWLVGVGDRSAADNTRSVGETVLDHLLPVGWLISLALIATATFVLARASSAARGARSWARSVGFGHGLVQAGLFGVVRLLANLTIRQVAGGDAADGGAGASVGVDGGGRTLVVWLTLAGFAVLGAIASIIVLGTYLRFANRQFRMHDNESYSARHSGENRHLARFRISPDGSLSCYLIAFRQTGTGWARAFRTGGPLPPADTSDPELIDVRFRTGPSDRVGRTVVPAASDGR